MIIVHKDCSLGCEFVEVDLNDPFANWKWWEWKFDHLSNCEDDRLKVIRYIWVRMNFGLLKRFKHELS